MKVFGITMKGSLTFHERIVLVTAKKCFRYS